MIYITEKGKVRYDLGGFEDMSTAIAALAKLPDEYHDGKLIFVNRSFVVIEAIPVANPRRIGVIE